MKNVLVTGADGFIGSHLTEMLLNRGYKVTALSQYNSFNSWGWLDDVQLSQKLNVVTGDIRDPFFCKEITKNQDIVFHLAALIAIPFSYVAPHSYVETNVLGTLNICNACRENNVSRIIHTSTSEVYGTARYVPIDEKHPKQPQSPYSASKIAADMMALSYYNSFDLPLTVARPFNTYGPRQSARAIIPTIISQIASGANEILVGDLSPTRDFTFVSDTCRGFIAIAESNKTIGKEINISTNFEISMQNIFDIIKNRINSNVTFIKDQQRIRPTKSEVQRLWGDNTLISTLTDWKPEYDISRGLEETINWFGNSDNLKKYKANIYNI